MDRPFRVLVAGCGNMGASHARAYHRMPEFEIVGLVSRGPDARATRSATELGGLPEFADYDEALRATRPDVVSINTYPETHGPFARAAIEAGCHVFCEKPLATTVEEAQAVVDAARAARPQAGDRLHPARPPGLDAVHRDRPHAGQAARDADEPQPAEPRAGLELAPQPDGVDEPHRRLRRPLRRRHVPDDGRPAGARLRDRRPPHRRAEAGHVQLRPAPGHLRRRLGGLVRGGLGPDDERGGVLREGRGRPEGLRLHRQGPERGHRTPAPTTSTATRRPTACACTTAPSTPTTSS